MGRWTALSDMDYYESCNPMHRAELEPAPVVQSPAWWQAEFARIAKLDAILRVIRDERTAGGRSPA